MQLNFFDISNSPKSNQINGFKGNLQPTLSKIKGLKYIPEFISKDEESQLWNAINNEAWLGDLKRRVQHYGWKYDYKARAINYSMYLGKLPNWVEEIADKLFSFGFLPTAPDQLIINEYKPGQGIANHVDCEPCFGETIISVSLGSTCVMDFIHLKSKEKIEVLLEPRSVVVISGEARHNWTHGIPARQTDNFNGIRIERKMRISLTFRNVVLNKKY